MRQREANVAWLRDLIEHLGECQRQLEWTDEPELVRLLTESMLHDLDRCRSLCQALRRCSEPVAA